MTSHLNADLIKQFLLRFIIIIIISGSKILVRTLAARHTEVS
jgi:hypothetical protein